jgi:hypothetical protein
MADLPATARHKRRHPLDAPLHHVHRWLPNTLFSWSSPGSLRNPSSPTAVDPDFIPDLQQSDFAETARNGIVAYQQARPELTYAQVLVRHCLWHYIVCVFLVSVEGAFMIGQVQLLLKILYFMQDEALGLEADVKAAYINAMWLSILTLL